MFSINNFMLIHDFILLEYSNNNHFFDELYEGIKKIVTENHWGIRDRLGYDDRDSIKATDERNKDFTRFKNLLADFVYFLISKYEDPAHKLIFKYGDDMGKTLGSIYPYNNAAYMTIAVGKIINYGIIPFVVTDDSIFNLARTIAHEFLHYQQYLKNWNYHLQRTRTKKPQTSDEEKLIKYLSSPHEIQAWAADAAKDFINDLKGDHYANDQERAKVALKWLKNSTILERTVFSSNAMMMFLDLRNKLPPKVFKNFMKHVFKNLEIIAYPEKQNN